MKKNQFHIIKEIKLKKYILLLFLILSCIQAQSIQEFLQQNQNQEKQIQPFVKLSSTLENYQKIKNTLATYPENIYLHHKINNIAYEIQQKQDLQKHYLQTIRKYNIEQKQILILAQEYFLGYFYHVDYNKNKDKTSAWLALYHYDKALQYNNNFLPAWTQLHALLQNTNNYNILLLCKHNIFSIINNTTINPTYFRVQWNKLIFQEPPSPTPFISTPDEPWIQQLKKILQHFPYTQNIPTITKILHWYLEKGKTTNNKNYFQKGLQYIQEILQQHYQTQPQNIKQEIIWHQYLAQFAFHLEYYPLVQEENIWSQIHETN